MTHYTFEFEIGRIISFDPAQDTLSIVAQEPDDVSITTEADFLVLTTAAGSVALEGVGVEDLHSENIFFCAPDDAPSPALAAQMEADTPPIATPSSPASALPTHEEALAQEPVTTEAETDNAPPAPAPQSYAHPPQDSVYMATTSATMPFTQTHTDLVSPYAGSGDLVA